MLKPAVGRSRLLRYGADRPSPGRNRIARASIGPSAIQIDDLYPELSRLGSAAPIENWADNPSFGFIRASFMKRNRDGRLHLQGLG